MVLSLICFLSAKHFKKKEAEFSRENKVLMQGDIEALVNDENAPKAIRAFKSAVLDHEEIALGEEKRRLYTSYPKEVKGWYFGAGHDNFRRAEIAYGIGNLSDRLKIKEIEEAVSVLDALTMNTEKKYTQILAWNSLGIIGRRMPYIFNSRVGSLKRELNEKWQYPIGALTFLEKIINTSRREKAVEMLNEALESATVKNGLLIKYFMAKEHITPRTPESEPTICDLDSFSKEDVIRGLELIGLIGPSPPFRKKTPQAREYKHIVNTCINFIGGAGYIERLNFRRDCEFPFAGADSLIEKGYA
jgi:hypothetical protein